ncbi:type I-C CRISPR-associated protein Cas8c/Csd1 [Novispirillum itersonii]|uniref:CRISPR-associated protein Csd1 n=1 Tax=Novispirillum itersonii TaxID=189 RepID=A0A7W9ZHR3_NOVIT|nr:type I-C CRISPR-associated protein Cas8c/Csd1 [Novispirillum itersonii]MBB6210324.1 CRISPR-associated protein Csd1 [Novispirillum itersonii]
MILQRLNELYDRLAAEDGEGEIPRLGFGVERISWAVVLRADGSVRGVTDLRNTVITRQGKGKKETSKVLPRPMVVPKPASPRTSGVMAFPFWDKTSYALGAEEGGDPKKIAKHFPAFRALQAEVLTGVDDAGARAFLAFLAQWQPEQAAGLEHWAEITATNVVFMLDGEPGFLHDRPAFRDAWLARCAAAEGDVVTGQCLITGQIQPVAKVHSPLRGVVDAQTSGAAMVSFNKESFCSYGRSAKDQGLSAPIGQPAAFAYTTALNHLLRGSDANRQKLTIGDTTLVYWANLHLKDGGEALVHSFLTGDGLEGDAETEQRLDRALRQIRAGVPPRDVLGVEADTRFYLLGLSAPGKARLTVRYWEETTLGAVLTNVQRHHAAMAVVPSGPNPAEEPQMFGLWQCLTTLVPEQKREEVPGPLVTTLLNAVLHGTPYPAALLPLVLERIRHGQSEKFDPLSALRVGLLKATLIRNYSQEITVSLNPQDKTPAYCLGRLFAVLEKAQKDALPGLNATIKDRYFAAASATPAMVFPVLLKLATHHIAKDEYGQTKDRQIGEIMELLTSEGAMPDRLSLSEQAHFAVGYYHQRTDLYRKKADSAAASPDVSSDEAAK